MADRCLKVETLDAGGQGQVWKAQREAEGQLVRLKFMLPNASSPDPAEDKARFIRGIPRQTTLRHRRIAAAGRRSRPRRAAVPRGAELDPVGGREEGGLNEQTYGDFEAGRTWPVTSTLYLVADALEVDLRLVGRQAGPGQDRRQR